jgi:transglutaminase-like putative cysteine protease
MVAIRILTVTCTYIIGLSGILPLFPWLTTFPRVILAFGLVSGIWQDRRGRWGMKPWMQNVAIVPVFLYYALQFSRANPVEPVVSVLAIMLAVRLSGEKTVRHSLQVCALSMFCLASSSLFDLSPLFLVYLGVLLFMVALALVLLTFQNQDHDMTVSMPDLKRILLSGLLMPVMAVPLLLIFFPIMPRTQLPLWHFLNQPATRTSGYSDTVEPGSQSSVAVSRTLAFRAEMPRLAEGRLYWRGTVFNRTDGNRWTRVRQIPSEQVEFTGQTTRQVIYPEPSGIRTLIALDRPAVLSLQRVTRSPDGVFEYSKFGSGRLSYSADSHSSGITAQRNSINRPFYLQLPDQLPSRIKALAAEIVRSGTGDRSKVEFLENFFRNGGYRYSTSDLATGDRALELFLFDGKQGHCEFFASSFALLLRAAGVPCRLVGGYLGGEYNELGGYYLVSDDRAHVWVEAFIEGSGWVRIDPSSFAANAGELWTAPTSRTLMLRMSLLLDSFNYVWNRTVINYDFEQQMTIARNVGSRLQGISPSRIIRGFAPYLAGGLLVAGLLLAAGRASLFRSREQRILRTFQRTVEREFNVIPGAGGVGLFELALTTDNSHVSDFVAIYAGAIYHDRRLTDDECVQLRRILRDMKGVKSKIP